MRLLTLTVLCFSYQVYARDFSLSNSDHRLHFAVSVVASHLTYATLRLNGVDRVSSLAISAIAVFAIGLAKECLIDRRLDWSDVTANSVGITFGISLPFVFGL